MTYHFSRHSSATATQEAPSSHLIALGWLLLGAALLMMVGVPTAHAEASAQDEVASAVAVGGAARVNGAALTEKSVPGIPIALHGVCHEGQAVFTVTNKAKDWAGRGFLRVSDTQSGYTLRERWMRFKEGQSASFHILPGLAPSGRYQVSVTLPDRTMTYKKSFRGYCPQPGAEVRNASR